MVRNSERQEARMKDLFEKSSLSIIGLGKNTGKTSFLNELLEEARVNAPGKVLAITSIGRDGEEKDLVTSSKKPRIYIYEGTLVATSTDLLGHCDVIMEILEVLPLYSALGRVVLFRALSDGFVEIAGPSRKRDLRILEKAVRIIEPQSVFIVDGALSRMSFATATEGTVLCTGVNISRNPKKVLEKTVDAAYGLTIEKTKRVLPSGKGRAFIYNGLWEPVEGHLAMDLGKEILERFSGQVEAVYLKGAVTDHLLSELLSESAFRKVELILEDPTKLLLSHEMMQKMDIREITLNVENTVSVELILFNPYETTGLEVPSEELMAWIERETSLPVVSLKDLQRRRRNETQ